MTSIATIAGALPPALAIGPGAELQRPMALAIVGGHDRLDRAHPVRRARGLQPARRRRWSGTPRAGGGARGSWRPCGPRARPEAAVNVSRTRDVLGLTAFVVLCFGVSVLGGRATRVRPRRVVPGAPEALVDAAGLGLRPGLDAAVPADGGGGVDWPGGRAAPASGRSSSCCSWRSTPPGRGSSSRSVASTWRSCASSALWVAILGTDRAFWRVEPGRRAAARAVPRLGGLRRRAQPRDLAPELTSADPDGARHPEGGDGAGARRIRNRDDRSSRCVSS